MNSKFDIRPYRKGDEEGIVQLLQLVFNGWPHLDLRCTAMDHWKWKYESDHIRRPYISVAVSDEEIIGCHHSIPFWVKIGDKIRLCTSSFDYAVHPDFRKMGISTKMGTDLSLEWRRKEGVYLDYHITGNPILIRSFSKSKPRFPYKITNLVWIEDFKKQLQAMPVENPWKVRLGYVTLKLINNLKKSFTVSHNSGQDVDIIEIDEFDNRIDDFWAETSDFHNFIVVRNRGFLNWRYCDPRGGKFIVKQAVEKEKVLGYVVAYINYYRKNYPIGYIVDLLTLPHRIDVAKILVDKVLSYFVDNGVNIVNYQVVNGHPYQKILNNYGFLNSRIEINMFYNPIVANGELIELERDKPERTHISWGDHDVLPVTIPRYQ